MTSVPYKNLGRWRLHDLLGVGGNGDVWTAIRDDGTKGAIKLLKPQFQDPNHKRFKRFKDEIETQATLSSVPGVLPVLDYHIPEHPSPTEPAWLVTLLAVEIRNALKNDADLRSILEAVAAIAETLALLHERGISHRDIKPSNLFNLNGSWAIGDFGLVDYPGKSDLTDHGERMGPAHFIAPEMTKEHGDASQAEGIKADVYSLAKTLWVLATRSTYPPPGELRRDSRQLTIGAYVASGMASFVDSLLTAAPVAQPLLE